MSQKLPLNGFDLVKSRFQFTEAFDSEEMKGKDEDGDEEYFDEVDVQYPEELHELHKSLLFLPERIKIQNVEKHLANFHDQKEYIIHTRNLKQTLNHRLALKKLDRVIKFNQKSWLKPNIDMNTEARNQ